MHFFCIVFFPRSPDKSDVTRPWFWASVCISVPVMCTPVYIFICIHTTDLQLGVSQTISWFPCENSLLFSFQLNFLIINEPFNTIRSTTFPELSPGKPKGNVEFGRRLNGSSTNHIEDLQCMQKKLDLSHGRCIEKGRDFTHFCVRDIRANVHRGSLTSCELCDIVRKLMVFIIPRTRQCWAWN